MSGCLPYETIVRARGGRPVPATFPCLWVAGAIDVLERPVVAIVGTRAATAYGKRLARTFAAELGRAGCCIISGLALGIDTEAHLGALEAPAPTIGVLGSGHGTFFPKRNRGLGERIVASGGAVLSPYPPEREAYPSQFLERNGVVAALSDAVVVIEAPARSGALNTAGWAAGRIPVFAVPGDVDRQHVAGCHALIRDGAILARCARDVLDDLRLSHVDLYNHRPDRDVESIEDPLKRCLMQALTEGESSLEDLVTRSKAAPAAVLAALSMLEIEELVDALPGQRYAMRR